jgi:cytochrome c
MSDEHSSPIKTPKQLVIVLVLAFVVPIALFLLLSQLVTGMKRENPGETDARVLARIKPVGELTIASAAGAPAAATTAAAPATTAAPAATVATATPAAATAAKPAAPLDLLGGEELMKKDGCAACHAVDKKIVGPAYQDVAAKYRGDKGAAARLEQKVKTGGSGVWGPIPMPPNAVPDADIKALVTWILTLKK